jgi:hypothetical protein
MRRVVSPLELESQLESRLEATRWKSGSVKRHRQRHGIFKAATVVRKPAMLVVGLVGAMVLSIAAFATNYTIDLTTAGSSGTVNGGIFVQGGVGAGTGTFDPFLSISPGGSTPQEAGVNSCVDNPTAVGCKGNTYDTFYGGGRTHAIQVAGIPSIHYPNANGPLYRQFSLDANDQGADDFMSIDEVKIFTDDQANLHEFDGNNTFADDTGTAALNVWDTDDTGVLMRSQSLTPGSGVSDITLLIPNDRFPTNCFYGSTTCNQWLYFWTHMGGAGVINGHNYDVTAGFEEWRVQLLPVVNVAKTATPTFDRTFDWTVQKSVLPTSLNLFDGQSGDVTWSVTPTRGTAQDSNWKVTGTITVTNPTGSGAVPTAISATVNSVVDQIDGSLNATVTCPNVTFPKSLAAGASFNCTYVYTYGSQPAAGAHTNVATANIDISDTATQNYSGSATFDFANATPTVTDATATLTDLFKPLNQLVTGADSGTPITYKTTYTCGQDEGDHTNTATLVETDSQTSHQSSATATVNCYQLTVAKDAHTSSTRSYDWQITKERFIAQGEVDGDGLPSTLTLGLNETFTASYHVTVSVKTVTDSNFHVTGTITISNPAPMVATGVAVSDVITGPITATVDCNPNLIGNQTTVNVPAKSGATDGQATCTYSADLPNGTSRTNTATATLFGVNYTGTAPVVFDANTTLELVDECVTVTDNHGTPANPADDTTLGVVCANPTVNAFTAPHTFTFTLVIGPFADCGPHTFTNTATYLVVNDANDTGETGSASYTVNVDVPCPQGCTLTQGYWKTHNDSFWGGAPTDPTWDLIGPDAEQTIFFLSGKSYFDVMWTSGGGNAYYILAKQYIAAQLNMLAGADGTAITTQFATATTLFNTYTPAQIGALKGSNALRQQFISLAGVLGQYNEGLIGPGHCDEDGASTLTNTVTKTSAQLAPADLRRWALMA